MPASFLHGIEVFEFNLGPVPITVVNSAVIGLVGSAPLWAVPGAIPLWDPSWLVIAAPQWTASTAEAVGNLIVDSNGNTQKCTTAGTTGVGAPTWSTVLNGTTNDNGVIWTMIAVGAANAGQKCIDANGNVQTATAITLASWAATHAYTSGNLIVDSNGNTQRVTSAGTSGGSAPSWSTTLGGTTTDSGVTWTLVAIGKAAITNTSAPSWATSLNSTTADTIGASTGTVTWTLTQLGPIANLQAPVLISGTNPNSGAAGQAGSFGPLIQGYTIPYALNQAFAQGAGLAGVAPGPAIVVNVFDQTKHHSSISAQTYNFPASGNQVINVGHMGLGNLKLTNSGATVVYVEGADFTVDRVNGIITAKGGGLLSSGQAVVLTCIYADPSQVADADLVGSVTSNVYTGMQAWKLSFGLMGFFPKILIAPSFGSSAGWQSAGSQDATVSAAMATVALAMRAVYLLDTPPLTPPATLISNRGASGNSWNTSDKRAILCGPQQNFTDLGIVPTGITINAVGAAIQNLANVSHDGPYSPFLAGLMSANDIANGYWWSPSNKQLTGALGPDVSIYSSAFDAASDTNNLNSVGIVTTFNGFASGLRAWGNRSAGYPSFTTPDVFIPVRRTMDVIEQSVQQAMMQWLDSPITNALIQSILASVNAFLRTLVQRGALIGTPLASYNPAENPASQLAAGQIVFDLDCMPPTPAERITWNVFIDTTQLASLTGTTAGAAQAALA